MKSQKRDCYNCKLKVKNKINLFCKKMKIDQVKKIGENRFQYNRWQCKIFTLSVHIYSDVTSDKLVFVSDKTIHNSDNFRISPYRSVK